MTRDQIVEEARNWIKTPFLHQGRSGVGVDCVGLVQVVGNAFGVKYDDLTGYARAPSDVRFLRHLRQFLTPQPIKGNRNGLVGVFRQRVFPCHIGIFAVSNGVTTVINSRTDRGMVVEELFDPTDLVLVDLLGFPGMED